MSNIKPYLCGGTFFTQLILNSANDTKETTILEKLLKIYYCNDSEENSINFSKPQVSAFKSCTKEAPDAFGFKENFMRERFDKAVKSNDKIVFDLTKDLVDVLYAGKNMDRKPSQFEINSKKERLVLNLLYIIQQDDKISPDTKFFISETKIATQKEDLSKVENVVLIPFLLGVWHYIITQRYNKNKNGEVTYKSWIIDEKDHIKNSKHNFRSKLYEDSEKKELIILGTSCELFQEFKNDFRKIIEYIINTESSEILNHRIKIYELYKPSMDKWVAKKNIHRKIDYITDCELRNKAWDVINIIYKFQIIIEFENQESSTNRDIKRYLLENTKYYKKRVENDSETTAKIVNPYNVNDIDTLRKTLSELYIELYN